MRKALYATVFACAMLVLLAAGAMTEHSTVSVLGKPDGVGPCSSSCWVGSGGQGGDRGNAQAEYFIGPIDESSTIRFIGPENSGRIAVSGPDALTEQGHIHGDGSYTGHTSGSVGTCSGLCG